MNSFLKLMFITIFSVGTLNATQARDGLLTFTQPDGTQFEGYLKGDSAFHWIESDSKVVLYNPDDRFYYNAQLGATDRLELSKEKPSVKNSLKYTSFSRVSAKKSNLIDEKTKEALKNLEKISKEGHRPK